MIEVVLSEVYPEPEQAYRVPESLTEPVYDQAKKLIHYALGEQDPDGSVGLYDMPDGKFSGFSIHQMLDAASSDQVTQLASDVFSAYGEQAS